MATVGRRLLNPQAPAYIPICHTNNAAFHPHPLPRMPYHFSTQPPRPPPSAMPSPPPPPTVDSSPRENMRRASVTRRRPNIPPRLRDTGRVAGQGGRGFCPASNGNRGSFGRGKCSNEGSVVKNDQTYEKWSRNNGLKKHDVIPIYWRQKNNTTSVMIKNIPYDYNREMLMQFLDEYCLLENQKSRDSNGENIVFAYDFLYLPMDFKNKRSKGYAFVNFTDDRTVWKFFGAFNDKLNVFHGSVRSVKVVTAKIQGNEALVNRFKETRFECESEGFLPVWFRPPRDGYGESVMITVGKCKGTPTCSYVLKKP
ncbi:unnamed protein product [Withania somnifera]